MQSSIVKYSCNNGDEKQPHLKRVKKTRSAEESAADFECLRYGALKLSVVH